MLTDPRHTPRRRRHPWWWGMAPPWQLWARDQPDNPPPPRWVTMPQLRRYGQPAAGALAGGVAPWRLG
ncbi:MAG: hypothetical protein R2932_52185 [Caldilineaceae bacterium]